MISHADARKVLAKARADLLEAGIDEDELAASYEVLQLLDNDRLSLTKSWLLEVNETVGELASLRAKIPADVWVRMKKIKADLPERRKRSRLEERLAKAWHDRPALLRPAAIYRPEDHD